ncbi:hypothetical protein D3C87_914860 [compost metagenome]
MEKVIIKDGIVVTDTTMDETGRFPVGPDYYKEYEQPVLTEQQKHFLQMFLISVEGLSKECEDDDFNDWLSTTNWFGMSLDEMANDILRRLHP